ncbi:hypothetical protein [Pseudomonas sp. BMW13]|nr:hypothetical protein [Pseudomonas sp. BMW13]
MQVSNDTPTSTAMTLLGSTLAVLALLALASVAPDALQAAIR